MPSLLQLLLLLLLPLLLFLISSSNAKPRAPSQLPEAPLSDPLLDSIIAFAQVPSSRGHPQSKTEHHAQNQQDNLWPQTPDDDFIFATGSCRERMHLAKSTRAWRRGLRAFVLTDQDQEEALAHLNAEGDPHNESYAFFPDDRDQRLGGAAHGTKQGDTRAAVAPFAAHRHYKGAYKWMLYGDDDTLFFMEPVKRMLAGLDPNMPLAISDNLWYSGTQPNAHAPRCLPCHMSNDTLPTLDELVKQPHVREHLRKYLLMRSNNVSEADVEQVAQESREVPGRLFVPSPVCGVCTPDLACNRQHNPKLPCNPSVAHGGAGMIFSVGLMRLMSYRDVMACFRSFQSATGGDALVSYCLWRRGFAFTDPGPLVRHMYDPYYHVFGGKSGQGFLWDPIGMISHGRCPTKCRWLLRNALSLHLKGRHFRNWRVGAVLMWGVAHASQAAQSFLDLATRDGETPWNQLPYGYDVDDVAGFAPYMALAAPPTPVSARAASAQGS